MPTPANRAKIQLVRGSYSNINASLADLVDGELCYAKDENRLYMVEGSTLTPVVAEDDEVLVEVHNQSGSDIAKGKPVYVSGTHSSGKPIVDLTDSNGTNTYPAIGLVYETIANGADGKVIVSGLLSNISTNALGNAGDALYISSTAGGLTTTRPTAATEQVQKVGLITRSHASNGSVLVIGAGRTNDVPNEIAVSNLANGTARQLLQTDAAGTGVEFTSNVDVPGTLDVTSAATFDNNVTIEGDLTVNGTTTTIDTTTLIVEDKNIEMGSVSTPTDITADGGGITLKGATDKTINWVNTTGCWTFNQPTNFNNHVRIDSSGNVLLGGTLPSAPAIELKADGSGEFAKQVIVGENTDAAGGTFIGVDGYINLKRPSSSQGGFPLFLGKLGGTETSKITADGSITAAGRVGIGTTSPGVLLDISGSGAAGRITNTNSGSTSSVIFGNDLGSPCQIFLNGSTKSSFGGSGALNIYQGSANPILFSTNNTERLRIDSSGNVGIGTTTPSSELTISSATTPTLTLIDTTNTCTSILESGNTEGRVGTTSNHDFTFRTNNTERMRIDSAGSVLIGTHSDLANAGLYVTGKGTSDERAINIMSVDGNGGGLIGTTGDSTSSNGLAISSYRGGGHISFRTAGSDSSDEKVRVDSSGNVGIGTSSPSERLEVTGNAILDASSATLKIKQGGAGTTGKIDFTFESDTVSVGSLQLDYDDRDVEGLRLGSIYPITLAAGAGQEILFKRSTAESARIDSSGRLLVGTSSSLGNAASLQTSGQQVNYQAFHHQTAQAGPFVILSKSRGTQASPTAVATADYLGIIGFSGYDGTDYLTRGAEIACQVDGTPGSNDMPGRLVFSTTADGASSPTERLRIDSAGNLGIGTTTPAVKLDINGKARSTSTVSGDVGTTLATKDYVDSSTGGAGSELVKRTYSTEVTVTNGDSEVEFTGIPADVSNLRLVMQNLGVSGTNNMIVQVGHAGSGGTYLTTGYESVSTNVGTGSLSSSANTSGIVIRFASASHELSGVFDIYPSKITNPDVFLADSALVRINGTNQRFGTGITPDVSGVTIDRIKLRPSSGNTFNSSAGSATITLITEVIE